MQNIDEKVIGNMYGEIIEEMKKRLLFNSCNSDHDYALRLTKLFFSNRERTQVISYSSDKKLLVLFIEKNPSSEKKEVIDKNANTFDALMGKNKKTILVQKDPLTHKCCVSLNFNFLADMIKCVSSYKEESYECVMQINNSIIFDQPLIITHQP